MANIMYRWLSMNRILPVIAMGVFLSGCGIMPMWASVAHTVGDAVLSFSTGKSSGEHGLSFITGRDCQFIRIIDGQSICMSGEAYLDYLISLNCDIYTWNILNRVSCEKVLDKEEERVYNGNRNWDL